MAKFWMAISPELCASDDSIAPVTDETMQALRLKHPPENADAYFLEKVPISPEFPGVNEGETWTAIMSCPNGSTSGPDGLKPEHLKDLNQPSWRRTGK